MGKIGYGRRWIGCVVAFHSLVASGGWKLGRFWKGSFHGWLIIGVNWYVIVFCLDELLMELLSSFFFHSFQRNIGRIVKFRYYKRFVYWFALSTVYYNYFHVVLQSRTICCTKRSSRNEKKKKRRLKVHYKGCENMPLYFIFQSITLSTFPIVWTIGNFAM